MTTSWPDSCPTCHAPWRAKSKTMGARNGQPHNGQCKNGHWWDEPVGEPAPSDTAPSDPPTEPANRTVVAKTAG